MNMAASKATRKSSGKTKFSAAEGKDMIRKMENDDYEDIVKTVIENIQKGKHLDRYPERKKFIIDVCSNSEMLVQCIMDMILLFLDLYRLHSKGKQFLALQQAWFNHISDYFDDDATESSWRRERKILWSKLIAAADVKIGMADQRIVASTLTYEVYDLRQYTCQQIIGLDCISLGFLVYIDAVCRL